MKDIEEELRKKYNDIKIPDNLFDIDLIVQRAKEEKSKRRKKIIKVASFVIVILLIGVAPLIFKLCKNNVQEKNIDDSAYIESEKNENEINVAGNIIINPAISFINYRTDRIIYNVYIEEILDKKIENGIPMQKVKAKVLDAYLGETKDEIEIWTYGGLFKIKDLKENMDLEDNEDVLKFNDEDYVNVTYYSDIYMSMAEVGKNYLVTLYNDEDTYYVYANLINGFKEYDSKTDCVKDIDGKWIYVDIEKYVESNKI